MKVALIHPKGTYLSSISKIQNIIQNAPPFFKRLPHLRMIPHLGLLTIGAMAQPHFDEIVYIDENVDHKSDYLKEAFDLVCISGMTHQANRAYEIARHFRSQNIPVMIGGVHASLMPDEAEQYATTVVVGEVDDIWEKIMADFHAGKLKKRYQDTGKPSLQGTMIPNYDIVDTSRFDVYPLQTTRGCPHQCEFCVVHEIYGRKYRKKEIDHIIASVERIKRIKRHPVIFFTDDNMFVDKQFSKKLLKELIPLNIKWSTQTDLSIADDDELLALIRKSGGFQILIGLETLNEKNLETIEHWKASNRKKYSHVIEKIQSYGICIIGTFMVGLDEDTSEVFPELLKFIRSTGLFDAQVLISTPLPGTKLMQRLKREDRLLPIQSWDRFNLFNANYKPLKMTVEELEAGYQWIYENLYTDEELEKKMSLLKQSFIVYRQLMDEK